jgi:hypothetical protein
MKNLVLLLICLPFLVSCTSENETKGVDEVLKFYGGKVEWSIGVNASTVEEELQGKFFEITLMDVEISKYYSNASLPASNCAYLFYHALTEVEKDEYSFVRVILQEGEERSTHEFTIEKLKIVENAIPTLNQTVEFMKANNYESLNALFNPDVNLPEYVEELESYEEQCIKIDSTYGRIKEFLMQGFIIHDEYIKSELKQVVRLSGNLVREKQPTDFSITLDPALKDKKLYGLRFSQ